MLLNDDFAWVWREFGPELTTPRAVCEGLSRPRRLLNRRDIFPCLVIPRTISMMHGIENPQLSLARGIQNLQHMGNAIIRLGDGANAIPDLGPLK